MTHEDQQKVTHEDRRDPDPPLWSASFFYTDMGVPGRFEAPTHLLFPLDHPAKEFFSGGFRGWHFGAWNEAEPFEPHRLIEFEIADAQELEDFADRDSFPSDYAGPRLPRIFASMRVAPLGNAFSASRPAWVGGDDAVFVTATTMHAARQGGGGGDQIDDLGSALSPAEYVRLSVTKSKFLSGGLSIGSLSLNFSNARTDTTTDVFDVDGDGIADVVTPAGVIIGQLPDPRGLRPLLPAVPANLLGGVFRKRVASSYGLGRGFLKTGILRCAARCSAKHCATGKIVSTRK